MTVVLSITTERVEIFSLKTVAKKEARHWQPFSGEGTTMFPRIGMLNRKKHLSMLVLEQDRILKKQKENANEINGIEFKKL